MENKNLTKKLKQHSLIHDSIEAVKKEVQAIPKHELLKMSQELTLYVANELENVIPKKLDLDKRSAVIGILGEVYELTEQEKEQIGSQIDFLVDHKKIKKRSLIAIGGRMAASYMKSFFASER